MKIINNSAVEFFSTFCPSFNNKKIKKHARRLSAHVYTIQDLKNAPYLTSFRRRLLKSGTAMERRSRFSECRRHEWGGGWGGGGTRGG